jgi:hypothetical protein
MSDPVKKNVPVYVHILRVFALLCVMIFFVVVGRGQSVKFGNSYINISKKTVGGTVQPGDTLEIRTNIWFPNAYNSNNIYFARYIDNVPTNTVFADDSLRLITNEGLLYKRWTLGAGNDPGTYLATPPAGEYNVKITLGKNATAPTNNSNAANGGGTIVTGGASKDKPRAGGNVLITTSFRVKVTGAIGDTIVLGAGQIRYKKINSINTSDTVVNVIQYKILISNNDPICPNSIGRNFVAEAGGTFDSGSVQNRSYPPTFSIPTYTYLNLTSSQAIGDGTYSIVNNLSPWASTYQNAEKKNNCVTSTAGSPPPVQSCANRMFGGHWDIIGDHTGTLSATGNAPVAVGTRGGYMLVVNADYATSEAYRQAIKGLCPNTTYEFSLWVKNVCTNCGADSTGAQTYKPGVYPNLSFAIDGLDRYSSGQVDTVGWMKKGFLFKTGPSQDSITISIRNNASGGGGNDWAIDDIALVTCNPLLNLIPSGDAQVCYNSQVDISSTVNSFFNNYTYYRFERSTDNGTTWTTPGTGTGTPLPISGGYEYTAQLVPSFLGDSAHHLNQYRFVVASSPQNLSNPDCSFTASTRIVVMVNDCSITLSALDSSMRQRRVITRSGKNVEIRRLINPVSNKVSFDLITTGDGLASITLIDSYGRIIRQVKSNVLKGFNHVILDQISGFGSGTYFLRVNVNGETLHRRLVKL